MYWPKNKTSMLQNQIIDTKTKINLERLQSYARLIKNQGSQKGGGQLVAFAIDRS